MPLKTIESLKKIDLEPKDKVFFEMGTSVGNGVQLALDYGYKKVISIEIVEEYHNISKKRFEQEILEGRVELYLGDAEELLDLCKYIPNPIVFFIDAHFDPEHYAQYAIEHDYANNLRTVEPQIHTTFQRILDLKRKKEDIYVIDDYDCIRYKSAFWSKKMKEPGDLSHIATVVSEDNPDMAVMSYVTDGGHSTRKQDLLVIKLQDTTNE
jgi:hypothetical protein